jgi:hypothetical protein
LSFRLFDLDANQRPALAYRSDPLSPVAVESNHFLFTPVGTYSPRLLSRPSTSEEAESVKGADLVPEQHDVILTI